MPQEQINQIILDKLKIIESDVKDIRSSFNFFKGAGFVVVGACSFVTTWIYKMMGLN